MKREYIGRITINGEQHKMVGESREAVAWAMKTITETAAKLGWEIRDLGIMTQLRSSITGEIIGRRMQTRLSEAGLEVVL